MCTGGPWLGRLAWEGCKTVLLAVGLVVMDWKTSLYARHCERTVHGAIA